MAADAIALVVVGSGEVTANEVNDLLTDAYPDEIEIGLIVPVDKDLFTDAVEFAVDWFDNDGDVYPVQTEGASMTRRAAKLGEGTEKVDKFTDFLDPKEFKDWDEVHVLIAMPEDPETDEYDFYAEIAEVATEAGFKVKDLTAGLDDIVMTDAEDGTEDEPDEEPEAVEETPKRGRGKAKDPEPAEEPEEKPARRSRAKKAETIEEVMAESKQDAEPMADVTSEEPDSVEAVPYPPTGSVESNQLVDAYHYLGGLHFALGKALEVLGSHPDIVKWSETAQEGIKEVKAKEEPAPKRGRGRPRTKFEVKQVWDEDDEKWVPRPAGRLRKGTEWRTIHSETDEVLEEGTI